MRKTDLKLQAKDNRPPRGGSPRAAFFGSFGCRLYIFLLLVVIPALAITLHEDFNEQGLEKARLRDEALALSDLAAANQESLVVNTRQLLATFGQSPLLLSSNRSVCETYLRNLRKVLPDYGNLGLIETNGNLFCSARPWTNAVYLGDRVWFQSTVVTKKFSVGDFQISRLTKEPVVIFAYPVLDEHGKL